MKTCLLAVMLLGAMSAYAQDPQPHCAVSSSPAPFDRFFGYPYNVTASCDQIATTMFVGMSAYSVDPNHPDTNDAGAVQCNNTAVCTGQVRFACLRPGSYNLKAGMSGMFVNSTQTFSYEHDETVDAGSLSAAGTAHLSVRFTPSTVPGYVQASVDYVLPQQYFIHTLNAVQYSGPFSFYAFSGLLGLSGTWDIPMLLIPGATLHVTPGGCYGDQELAGVGDSILDVAVPKPPPSTLSAVVSLATPGTSASHFTKALQPSTHVSVKIPLGTAFTIGLQKSTGDPVASVYTLGTSAVKPSAMPLSTATVMPKVISLFGGKTAVQVDNDDAATTKKFIAVHLGTVSMLALPVTTTDPSVQFDVDVVPPAALGSGPADFDTYITNVAHNTGIPPQYIKGQVAQERFLGRMTATNYRYEPCGADLRYVSGGQRLAYTDASFIRFRLDDAIGTTLHPGAQDELDPRDVFFIKRADPDTGIITDRPINDDDRDVTAREIWDNNNSVRATGHIRFHFDTGCASSIMSQINADESILEITAQTPTAASYGLLQVMWDEARSDQFWNGVTVAGDASVKEPKYLFDRTEYVNIGGGTIQLGANKDASDWQSGSVQKFATMDAYETQVNRMMRRYNWAWYDSTLHEHYGDAVVRYSRNYAPTTSTTVLP